MDAGPPFGGTAFGTGAEVTDWTGFGSDCRGRVAERDRGRGGEWTTI